MHSMIALSVRDWVMKTPAPLQDETRSSLPCKTQTGTSFSVETIVKDLSQLMIQSNQPIDYLINSNHVTSIGTLGQYQFKPVLASAQCLRALLWLP